MELGRLGGERSNKSGGNAQGWECLADPVKGHRAEHRPGSEPVESCLKAREWARSSKERELG